MLPRSFRGYRFALTLLLGVAVGCVVGLILGPRAKVLKPLGDIFLNLMFVVVVPLVLVTITSSVASIVSLKRLGRILGIMLAVFAITGVIASVLMVTAVTAFPPAKGIELAIEKPPEVERPSTGDQIVAAITAPDFYSLLSKKNMLPLIVFSILLGLAISLSGEAGRPVAKLFASLSDVMIRLVGIVMWYAPIGLGAYFAWLIGDFGPQLLGTYSRAMLVYYPVSLLYFLIAFPLYAWLAGGRRGVSAVRRELITPAVTALATGSSVATLPVNLEAARRIGVPRDIRELVLPIGATIHMDGSCLSAILKIAFLFGVYGMDFTSPGTLVTAVGIALLSGMVMAGIPGGGFIGELLIVTLYGFPPEALAMTAVIGTLVDPPATMVNATGDTVSSMLVARVLEGPEWMSANAADDAAIVETPEGEVI